MQISKKSVWDKEKEEIIEQLFRENYKKLYLYAMYLIGDSEQAKDLVSDVFSQLLENHDSLRQETISSYLFSSVRNRSLDYLRHRQVVNQYAESYLKQNDVNDTTWDEYDEKLSEINEIISSMPSKTRFVMEQCFHFDKSYKEVGEILDITASGVKKHIMKGLSLIRANFSVNYKKGQGPNPNSDTY